MECPNCKLISPPNSMRCDCGYDFQSGTAEENRTFSTSVKTGLGTILKAVAGGAGLVCLLTPLTGLGVLVFVFALFVAIIAGVTGTHLSGKPHGGYWPTHSNPSGSR